jgi:hypothetical protein
MNASRVPDQVTTSQTYGVDWQFSSVRAGYHGTHTFQDSRQVGRENADAVNQTHTVSVSISTISQLMFTLDGSVESLENRQTSTTVRTNRLGLGISALLSRGFNTNINGTLSRSKDNVGASSQTQGAFSLESSYAFDLSRSFVFNWRGQLFVRYAWNEAVSSNALFDLRARTRAWVITTGISLNLF